ncbi:MAG: hypothetical protein GYB68_18665 [Chloroflexi bacterium]|nr:hypothetical protein [Chloroflexota bacterium]
MLDDFLYQHGMMNPLRIGGIMLGHLSVPLDRDEAAIESVAKRLGLPPAHVDDEGYEHEITAAALHPAGKGYAWVHCMAKESGTEGRSLISVRFRLFVRLAGQDDIEWEVYTYNPYFGCLTEYLRWYSDQVVMIYREKHDHYVAVQPIAEDERCYRQLGPRWLLRDGVIYHHGYQPQQVDRMRVPDLTDLGPIRADEARGLGLDVGSGP